MKETRPLIFSYKKLKNRWALFPARKIKYCRSVNILVSLISVRIQKKLPQARKILADVNYSLTMLVSDAVEQVASLIQAGEIGYMHSGFQVVLLTDPTPCPMIPLGCVRSATSTPG